MKPKHSSNYVYVCVPTLRDVLTLIQTSEYPELPRMVELRQPPSMLWLSDTKQHPVIGAGRITLSQLYSPNFLHKTVKHEDLYFILHINGADTRHANSPTGSLFPSVFVQGLKQTTWLQFCDDRQIIYTGLMQLGPAEACSGGRKFISL